MDSVPAHIVLWVSAGRCTYKVAIQNLAVTTVNIWIKIVSSIAVSAASLGPILQPELITKPVSELRTLVVSNVTVKQMDQCTDLISVKI